MKYININKTKILKINEKNTYIAIDFDRTITATESLDSWAASANAEIVGNELMEKMNQLYNKYRPIEMNYSMPIKEKESHMKKWYEDCMDLYYQYKLTKDKLIKSINKSNLIFRKGAKEFIKKVIEKQIPVIILSAGIGNVIEQYLKENDCYAENIYIISNFIEFDESGNMKEFDNNKIIHSLNKSMQGHLPRKFEDYIKNKEYGILIGDLIEDEKMIDKSKWDKTLKIGFLNNNQKENLEVYTKHFDIVLADKEASFEFLNQVFFKKSK